MLTTSPSRPETPATHGTTHGTACDTTGDTPCGITQGPTQLQHTAQHSTTQHNTTQHNIPMQHITSHHKTTQQHITSHHITSHNTTYLSYHFFQRHVERIHVPTSSDRISSRDRTTRKFVTTGHAREVARIDFPPVTGTITQRNNRIHMCGQKGWEHVCCQYYITQFQTRVQAPRHSFTHKECAQVMQ